MSGCCHSSTPTTKTQVRWGSQSLGGAALARSRTPANRIKNEARNVLTERVGLIMKRLFLVTEIVNRRECY